MGFIGILHFYKKDYTDYIQNNTYEEFILDNELT